MNPSDSWTWEDFHEKAAAITAARGSEGIYGTAATVEGRAGYYATVLQAGGEIRGVAPDGLSSEFGATTVHEGEAEVSRQLASVAKRVMVVADSSNLGKATFARICELDKIDILVTDSPAAGVIHDAMDKAVIGVIVAV